MLMQLSYRVLCLAIISKYIVLQGATGAAVQVYDFLS